MPNPDTKSRLTFAWSRLTGTLSVRLLVLLVASMAVVFGVLGYLNIQLHRKHLEKTTLADAARMSSVIQRNTSYYMLRNQRDGLYHIITDMANEPEMVRIRIINDQGSISFSSDPSEMGKIVDEHLQVHETLPHGVSAFRLTDGQ